MGLNTFPCNPYPISTEELNKGNNDDLNARVATLEEEVTDLSSSVAPEFSAEAAYTAGDIVWHEGGLYVFTADHAAGAWSTDDTQAVTVGGELATLSGDVSDLNSGKANQITIAPFFNPEAEYEAGDLVYYNGLTYRCTNDHQGAWDAADFAGTTIANELVSLKSGLTNLVKSTDITGTTDTVGDLSFVLPTSGTILLQIRPLRDSDYYNSWWGAITGSTGSNMGYSLKAIKDDGTALGTQAIKFTVYYI